MKIYKTLPEYKEVEIGDTVELLEDFTLIRKGTWGTVVGFESEKIRVEFPWTQVGVISGSPQLPSDKYILASPKMLKHVK